MPKLAWFITGFPAVATTVLIGILDLCTVLVFNTLTICTIFIMQTSNSPLAWPTLRGKNLLLEEIILFL